MYIFHKQCKILQKIVCTLSNMVADMEINIVADMAADIEVDMVIVG